MSVDVLRGPVGPTLLRMAAPMVVGIAAIHLFTVADTFWVGQLGAHELAAVGFTFPVIFVVISIAMGLSIGAASVLSREVGAGQPELVRRIATDALALAVVAVTAIGGAGLLTIDPLFEALGAEPMLMPLIRQYMEIWYMGVGLIVIPVVGNGAIRATGDTVSPAVIMIVSGGVNMALDPLLIFGWGPFPRLEIQGAAVATVISYGITLVASLWILWRRERLLTLERPRVADVIVSWKRILHIGIPSGATQVLVPASVGVLTRLVAAHGVTAVAAFGVGMRIEALSLVGIMALSSAATPFAGQNVGAGHHERVRKSVRFSALAALVWGVGASLVLAAFARPLGALFNDDPEVIERAVLFLQIIPVSYATLGLAVAMGSIFNGVGKPLFAAALIVIRMVVLAIPFAYAGSRLWGLPGLFLGITAANLVIGLLALALSRHVAPAGTAQEVAG